MSKRLQVLLDEQELKEIQKLADGRRMTTAEWVRQALRAARRAAPRSSAKKKLDAVRLATKHRFPTADIDEMLAQIGRGYADAAR